MSGLKLIAVLVVVGGLIAFIGDRIGMKIGRRRVTLFGLRPRHTSILITIASGVLIAAASITMLSFASKDVNTALFHMKEIQTALATSTARLGGLQTTVVQLRDELDQIVSLRDKAVRERETAQKERDALHAEYTKTRQDLDKARQDLEYFKVRVTQMKEIQESLDATIKQMQGTRDQLLQEIDALRQQSVVMRTGRWIYLKGDIVLATVIEAGEPAERTQEALLGFLDQADEKALSHGARVPGKNRAVTIDGAEYQQIVQALSRTRGRWVVRLVASQNTLAGEPVESSFRLFPEEKIFSLGEVVAERIVDGENDPEGGLTDLLLQVNGAAIARGMVTAEDGTIGKVLNGREFLDAIANLRQLGAPAVVVAIAAQDAYTTQPLTVRLEVRPAQG